MIFFLNLSAADTNATLKKKKNRKIVFLSTKTGGKVWVLEKKISCGLKNVTNYWVNFFFVKKVFQPKRFRQNLPNREKIKASELNSRRINLFAKIMLIYFSQLIL